MIHVTDEFFYAAMEMAEIVLKAHCDVGYFEYYEALKKQAKIIAEEQEIEFAARLVPNSG